MAEVDTVKELREFVKHNVLKSKQVGNLNEQIKIEVRNTILSNFRQYLTNVDDIFEFYVYDKYLPYAVEAIEDSLIQDVYEVVQTESNIFRAALREVSIDF